VGISISEYKKADQPLPDKNIAWQVFGAGFENLGKDGKPQVLPMREPADNELLLRVDALGLCLSDIKIITQGNDHARLQGRDLAVNPTVLGHECAVTVVKVGKKWAGQYKIGDRFIVQADIYINGVTFAFGYQIPGGMQQYAFVDEKVLDGDDGCYLLPVKDETGFSQSALSEPWACVEMSYCLEDRVTPKADGAMLVAADKGGDAIKAKYPHAVVVPRSLAGLPEGEFDDIVIENPTPAMVETLAARMRRDSNMYLLGQPAEQGPVTLDIGKIHYANQRYYGGADTLEGLAEGNKRADLLPQGSAVFIGAGGPMGQMHVQRSIELPCGSRKVVVTDLDRSRLDHINERFGAMAKAKGVELHLLAPSDFDGDQQKMNDRIRELSPNGYNDVCVLAPVPGLVTFAMTLAADNALVNVFAGIPIGNPGKLDLGVICRGVKVLGSSGSRISDMQRVLDLVESDQLNTDMSVAAIGGLNVAREGLEGVKAARFPGKTIIYPQIPDLPLIALEDIPAKLPEIAGKLGPGGTWTKEAEQALFEHYVA
jgi:L-sorbose 1-phosphate reductase